MGPCPGDGRTSHCSGFVALADDSHLQNAENITPVIRIEDLNADVREAIDRVSTRLTAKTSRPSSGG